MKRHNSIWAVVISVVFVALIVLAAAPDFRAFNLTQFFTDGRSLVAIKTGANVTNLVPWGTLQLPNITGGPGQGLLVDAFGNVTAGIVGGPTFNPTQFNFANGIESIPVAATVTNILLKGNDVEAPQQTIVGAASVVTYGMLTPNYWTNDGTSTRLTSQFGNAVGMTNYQGTNLANGGSSPGQILTATASGVAFSNAPAGSLPTLGPQFTTDGTKTNLTSPLNVTNLADQGWATVSGTQTNTGPISAIGGFTNGQASASTAAVYGTGTNLISLANGGANTVMHGTTPPTETAVVEADLSLTDVTTANVSTSAHGFTPKLPNDSTKFLNGTGAYSVPPGTGIAGSSNITDSAYVAQIRNATIATNLTLTLSGTANTASIQSLYTNTAQATSGNQQYSPFSQYAANAWKTTATAGSQPIAFSMGTVGVQGSAGPLGFWGIYASTNSSTPALVWSTDWQGNTTNVFGLYFGGSTHTFIDQFGRAIFSNSGEFDSNQLGLGSAENLGWQSGAVQIGGTLDAYMVRSSQGNILLHTNLIAIGAMTATNGFASYRSNLLAPTSITFPATTVNWTNPLTVNIEIYIDNSGITGTAVKKNGTQIFSSLVGDCTFHLQPGEYFSETYSVGTPAATYSPY